VDYKLSIYHNVHYILIVLWESKSH